MKILVALWFTAFVILLYVGLREGRWGDESLWEAYWGPAMVGATIATLVTGAIGYLWWWAVFT